MRRHWVQVAVEVLHCTPDEAVARLRYRRKLYEILAYYELEHRERARRRTKHERARMRRAALGDSGAAGTPPSTPRGTRGQPPPTLGQKR